MDLHPNVIADIKTICEFHRYGFNEKYLDYYYDLTKQLASTYMRWYAKSISVEFVREFSPYINLFGMTYRHALTEELIEEFPNIVDWYLISLEYPLTEDFIKKHAEKIHYHAIIQNDKVELTEAFFAEYAPLFKFYKV